MSTEQEQSAHLRLLQLLSPVLPVGNYNYSQGLEWAVHAQWISDEKEFRLWLIDWLDGPLAQQDLPILIRLFQASEADNRTELVHWSQMLLATRDTKELRNEELARANAFRRVLDRLIIEQGRLPVDALRLTPLASIAWAAAVWKIPIDALLLAYSYNWLENTVINGVKLIPLGQSTGQKIIHDLSRQMIDAVRRSKLVQDDDIGFSMPSVSMASSAHESQYSRLYSS